MLTYTPFSLINDKFQLMNINDNNRLTIEIFWDKIKML